MTITMNPQESTGPVQLKIDPNKSTTTTQSQEANTCCKNLLDCSLFFNLTKNLPNWECTTSLFSCCNGNNAKLDIESEIDLTSEKKVNGKTQTQEKTTKETTTSLIEKIKSNIQKKHSNEINEKSDNRQRLLDIVKNQIVNNKNEKLRKKITPYLHDIYHIYDLYEINTRDLSEKLLSKLFNQAQNILEKALQKDQNKRNPQEGCNSKIGSSFMKKEVIAEIAEKYGYIENVPPIKHTNKPFPQNANPIRKASWVLKKYQNKLKESNPAISGTCTNCSQLAQTAGAGSDEISAAQNNSEYKTLHEHFETSSIKEIRTIGETLHQIETMPVITTTLSTASPVIKSIPFFGFFICTYMLASQIPEESDDLSNYCETTSKSTKNKTFIKNMKDFLNLKKCFLTCGLIATGASSLSTILGLTITTIPAYPIIAGTLTSIALFASLGMITISIYSQIKRNSIMNTAIKHLENKKDKYSENQREALLIVAKDEKKEALRGIKASLALGINILLVQLSPLFILPLLLCLGCYMIYNNKLQLSTKYIEGTKINGLENTYYEDFLKRDKENNKSTLFSINLYLNEVYYVPRIKKYEKFNEFTKQSRLKQMQRFSKRHLIGELYNFDPINYNSNIKEKKDKAIKIQNAYRTHKTIQLKNSPLTT